MTQKVLMGEVVDSRDVILFERRKDIRKIKRMLNYTFGAEQTKSPFPNFSGKGLTIMSILSLRWTGCFLAF
jgi:hypothetical protein